jgi:uncharacterized protein YjhX (UPF0386 family)
MNPFRQLHPTQKKCKCGFTGERNAFNTHMAKTEHELVTKTGKMSIQAFFKRHGEVPCYADEPFQQPDLTETLEKSIKQRKLIDSL